MDSSIRTRFYEREEGEVAWLESPDGPSSPGRLTSLRNDSKQNQILCSARPLLRFQTLTDTQEETDRYWNAIVGNGGQESECGWCKDRWGLSWQITPRVLTEAIAAGGAEAKRAFAAMMEMGKIDVAKIEAARRG